VPSAYSKVNVTVQYCSSMRLNVPGIRVSSDDRRNDVLQSEFRDGWDLFHDVIAEELSFRNEGTGVPGVDGDRFGRVDEISGKVFTIL